MPLLKVNLTTAVPLSALDLRRLQCVQNSFAKTVANTTKYSHINPVRVFTGCLSCIALSSRWPYWCTSFYIVVIPNTLNLFFYPDTVCRECVEVNLMACCLRSHILHQNTSLKSILDSALHLMLQRFGMICLMMYAQLNFSLHLGGN